MAVVTEGVQIIIATPGRLNDLVEAGCIKIESVTYLVLDEVRILPLSPRMTILNGLIAVFNPRSQVLHYISHAHNILPDPKAYSCFLISRYNKSCFHGQQL